MQKWLYHLKHRYWNLNNIVLLVALILASSWVWGSITTMQRNFTLQKEVDARKRQLELTRLEVATLEYRQNYLRSDEYKELAAREKLGLVVPGEKMLILPPNSQKAKQFDEKKPTVERNVAVESSNLSQWISFFTGSNATVYR